MYSIRNILFYMVLGMIVIGIGCCLYRLHLFYNALKYKEGEQVREDFDILLKEVFKKFKMFIFYILIGFSGFVGLFIALWLFLITGNIHMGVYGFLIVGGGGALTLMYIFFVTNPIDFFFGDIF